jgi:hypothetical protein
VIYELFGLTVRSEIPLPELFEGRGDPDVVVGPGEVITPDPDTPGLSMQPEGALLWIPEVGRYLIRQGREILVDPLPGVSDRNIRLFLLGSAFGAILHQRGLLPLHANAIELDGRAVAFMGHSGAGKSTMAAWFLDRGCRVLADDVCVVANGPDGRPLAQPGIPRLRLWREAIEESGRTVGDYELAFDKLDKFNVPTLRPAVGGPLPLSHVYLLEKAEAGEAEIRRLQGVEAIDALIANTYRGGYLPMLPGGTQRHFQACLDLVRKVPVFSASRRWGFDRFDEEARALEVHARALIADEAVRPA